MKTVFIGYDSREHEAYNVCRFSIVDKSEDAVRIELLNHRVLRALGLFSRPWRIDEAGQYWDMRDGSPFSTEFSFTRFLVPAYANHLGINGWALFCDSDFLFLKDLSGIFDHCNDKYAVMCVKHDHKPTDSVKMDGMKQEGYQRKNWSSLMLWNLDHPANRTLTPSQVNAKPGRWLHTLSWLKDEEIGSLPHNWNFIPGVTDRDIEPFAIHYSEKAPWFEGQENCAYASEWKQARANMMHPRPSKWKFQGW